MPTGTKAAGLYAEIGAETSEYERKLRQAGQMFRDTTRQMRQEANQMAGAISGGLTGIASTIGVAGFVMLGTKIVNTTAQLAQQGMQLEALERNYQRLSGEGTASIETLRQATRGMVSDTLLLQAANKYLSMGLATSSEEAARLVGVASQLALVMGRDTAGAVDEFAQLLANQSKLRLDQFGIGAANVEARINALKAANAGMSDQMAFTQAVLAEAEANLRRVGDQSETNMGQVAKLQAAWANLRAEMGRTIEATVALKLITNFVEQRTEGLRQERAAADFMTPYKNILETRVKQYRGYDEKQYLAEREAIRQVEVALQSKRITEEQAMVILKERLGLVEEDLRLSDLSVASALREKEAIREATAAKREEERARLANATAAAAERAIVAAGYAVPAVDPWLQRRAVDPNAGRGATIQDQIRRDAQATQEVLNRMSTMTRQIASVASDTGLRSLIESVLQPTRVSDLDMARTRLGTYTDQWDEYIRRIRSAATDADSAWKHLIPTDVLAQGADAIKVWEAEQERLFYSGQMVGQINWDAVLADIQRQVQEKAAREALVQEAMRRAQAAGLGASQAQVAAALGIQDSGAAWLDTAQSFAAGLTKVDQAAQLTASFEQDLQGQQEKWVALGVLAVGWWATGVKRGGASVARDMAMLLAPYLQAALAERSPYP